MMDWLPWLPLAAACCHIFEEFVWPGGFVEWYRRYRTDNSRITTRMLLIANVLLLAACVNYALTASTRWGATALLGLCALLCSNGLWHAWASVKTHTVSPGVVTGILLYVPLMIVEFNVYLQARRVSLWAALMAFVVGGSYHLWSAVYHKMGAKAETKMGW
jgi:F0F1-type ATP synthase assembly protein I